MLFYHFALQHFEFEDLVQIWKLHIFYTPNLPNLHLCESPIF